MSLETNLLAKILAYCILIHNPNGIFSWNNCKFWKHSQHRYPTIHIKFKRSMDKPLTVAQGESSLQHSTLSLFLNAIVLMAVDSQGLVSPPVTTDPAPSLPEECKSPLHCAFFPSHHYNTCWGLQTGIQKQQSSFEKDSCNLKCIIYIC